MKKILPLCFLSFISALAVAQEAPRKTQFHLNLSYTNPFQKENNFTRIGSILGIRSGVTFNLQGDGYFGFDFSSSLFFPNGGGELGKPEILPQARFKFANSTKLYTEIAIGALYNPSAIGYDLNFSYALGNIGNETNIWSLYGNGVSQTFDNPQDEFRQKAPISWLGIAGIKYIRVIRDDLAIIIKPGIGLRGDSDNETKLIGNGSIVVAWKYFTIVGAYTNKVPEREFPSYFVLSAEVDIAKMFYKKSETKSFESPSLIGNDIPQSVKYHESILSY